MSTTGRPERGGLLTASVVRPGGKSGRRGFGPAPGPNTAPSHLETLACTSPIPVQLTGYTSIFVSVADKRPDGRHGHLGSDTATCTVAATDVGKTIKVRVTFTDGGDTEETLGGPAGGLVPASIFLTEDSKKVR